LSIDSIDPFCAVTGPINLNLNISTSLPSYTILWEASTYAIGWFDDVTIEDPVLTIPNSFMGSETLEVTVSNDDGSCLFTEFVIIEVSEGSLSNDLDSVMIACEDLDGIILGSTINANPLFSYNWFEDGVNIGMGPSLEVTEAGDYILVATDGDCTIQDTAFVTGGNNGMVDLSIGNDTIVEEGDELFFELSTNLAAAQIITTDWIFGGESICQQCDNVSFTAVNSGILQLEMLDDLGCPFTASISIIVNAAPSKYYIPNIFSPNNDGINDFFTVYFGEGVGEIVEIHIFDRWGAEVFSARNALSGTIAWDGKFNGVQLNPGVFSYYAILKKTNQTDLLVEGDITIII